MNPFEAFRNKNLAEKLITSISEHASALKTINIMEVCGTHTMNIHRFGITKLLPKNIHLISGPGCPVCVTPVKAIDQACALSRLDNVIIATFGDMVRVPGSESSLEKERAKGTKVQIVYSPLDALELARKMSDYSVVFLGVGFETTIPAVALTVKRAREEGIKNFFVFVMHKLIPPAMEALLEAGDADINGFICPAHVSAVIGTQPYEGIVERYKIPCVVAGFEPVDILFGIDLIVKQIATKSPKVEIEYKRVVRRRGNTNAQAIINEVYEPCDSEWRGLGDIPASGLEFRENFRIYDALAQFPVSVNEAEVNPLCLCGSVLKGVKTPTDCKLFGKSCTPESPQGACMVSSEGTCAAYYKYTDNHR